MGLFGTLGQNWKDADQAERKLMMAAAGDLLLGLDAGRPVGGQAQQALRDMRREKATRAELDASGIMDQLNPQQRKALSMMPASKAMEVVTGMLMQQPAAPTKGVEVDGKLVNPITGEVIYGGQTQPKFQIKELADGRSYYIDPTGQTPPRLVNPDLDMPDDPAYTTAVQGLMQRAEMAGLQPGTPEYNEFILRGGAEKGFALQIGADGAVQMTQGGASLPALTESQSKSATYATRAEGALPTLDRFDTALTSRGNRAAEFDPTGIAREFQSDEFQMAQQAGNEFLQAILRKDTGAAITTQEQALYGETYIPRPGDGPAVIEQKRQARRRALEALKAGMSPSAIVAQERALQAAGEEEPSTSKLNLPEIPEIPDFTKMSDEELDAYILKMGG